MSTGFKSELLYTKTAVTAPALPAALLKLRKHFLDSPF